MSQRDISREKLEECVDRALLEFSETKRGKRRCHEAARFLRDQLQKQGYQNFEVRDGIATYSRDLLKEQFKMFAHIGEAFEGVAKEFEHKLGKIESLSMFHSWCEDAEWVVDHQNITQIPETLAFPITIVEKKDTLGAGATYSPVGREFSVFGGNFLYIPGPRLPHIIKLEI